MYTVGNDEESRIRQFENAIIAVDESAYKRKGKKWMNKVQNLEYRNI